MVELEREKERERERVREGSTRLGWVEPLKRSRDGLLLIWGFDFGCMQHGLLTPLPPKKKERKKEIKNK